MPRKIWSAKPAQCASSSDLGKKCVAYPASHADTQPVLRPMRKKHVGAGIQTLRSSGRYRKAAIAGPRSRHSSTGAAEESIYERILLSSAGEVTSGFSRAWQLAWIEQRSWQRAAVQSRGFRAIMNVHAKLMKDRANLPMSRTPASGAARQERSGRSGRPFLSLKHEPHDQADAIQEASAVLKLVARGKLPRRRGVTLPTGLAGCAFGGDVHPVSWI
jgi:hypothetical protein